MMKSRFDSVGERIGAPAEKNANREEKGECSSE